MALTTTGLIAGGTWAPWLFAAAMIIATAAGGWALMGAPLRSRNALFLVWSGIALWVVGDVAWSMYEQFRGHTPELSVIDGLYLAGYPLIAIGVLRLLRVSGSSVRSGILDGAAFAAAASVLIWVLIGRFNTGDSSGLEFAVTASYPLADVLLVAGVTWLALTGVTRSRAAQWLAGGLAFTLVLDLFFALTRDESGWIATATDAAYAVSYGVLALGFTHPSLRESDLRPAADDSKRLHPARVVALGVALFVAPLTALITKPSDGVRYQLFLMGVTAVTAGVVLARFTYAVRGEEAARSEALYRASRDELTGLLNRHSLLEAVNAAVVGEQQGALLFLDLDGLKNVNDTVGHAAGDAMLREAARCLQRAAGSGDVVSRLGGDEFAVLCQSDGYAATAKRILEEFRRSDQLVEHDVSVSVGVSRLHASHSATLLLAQADAAMYEAKRAGGNRWLEVVPPIGA